MARGRGDSAGGRGAGGVARIRLRPRPEPRKRTLAERFFLRHPTLAPAMIRRVSRRSPHSRLRRMVAARSCEMGWEASSRGDFEMLAVTYHPDAEYTTRMPPELRFPDSPSGGTFRGRDAIREYIENFHGSWSEVHFKLTDVLLLPDDPSHDADHVVLTGGSLITRGRASGIETSMPLAVVIEIRDGWLWRQQDFWDHGEALRELGLEPDAFPGFGKTD